MAPAYWTKGDKLSLSSLVHPHEVSTDKTSSCKCEVSAGCYRNFIYFFASFQGVRRIETGVEVIIQQRLSRKDGVLSTTSISWNYLIGC
jgi:hypothetical protein